MRLAVLIGLLCVPAPVAAQCVVQGEAIELDEVVVPIRGEAPLSLTVTADVSVSPRGRHHRVEVRGGLAFSGESTSPTFSLVRRIDTGFGMVRLSTQTRLSHVRARGEGVSVTASPMIFMRIAGVTVPCDALTLGFAPDAPVGLALPEGDGTYWASRTRGLTLRREAGAGPGIRLTLPAPRVIRFARARRRGEWFHLAWGAGDGTVVRGWVEASAVRPYTNAGWGGPSGSGSMGCMPEGRRSGPGLYTGPAAVRRGAAVYTRADGPRWATFEADVAVAVYHARGEPWVQLRSVPGVSDRGRCESLSRAWVRLDDVTLPDDAETHRAP